MDGELIALYNLDNFHTFATFVDKFPSGIWIIHLGTKNHPTLAYSFVLPQ
jgi:hypothetical protein